MDKTLRTTLHVYDYKQNYGNGWVSAFMDDVKSIYSELSGDTSITCTLNNCDSRTGVGLRFDEFNQNVIFIGLATTKVTYVNDISSISFGVKDDMWKGASQISGELDVSEVWQESPNKDDVPLIPYGYGWDHYVYSSIYCNKRSIEFLMRNGEIVKVGKVVKVFQCVDTYVFVCNTIRTGDCKESFEVHINVKDVCGFKFI